MKVMTQTTIRFGISYSDVRSHAGQDLDEVEKMIRVSMGLIKRGRVASVELSRDGILFTVMLPEDVNAHEYADRVKREALEAAK